MNFLFLKKHSAHQHHAIRHWFIACAILCSTSVSIVAILQMHMGYRWYSNVKKNSILIGQIANGKSILSAYQASLAQEQQLKKRVLAFLAQKEKPSMPDESLRTMCEILKQKNSMQSCAVHGNDIQFKINVPNSSSVIAVNKLLQSNTHYKNVSLASIDHAQKDSLVATFKGTLN